MTDSTQPSPLSVTDRFIRKRLKPWLIDATPAQINNLRDRFRAYHVSHQRVRQATLGLISLEDFARQQFNHRLASFLPLGLSIEQLDWLVLKPSIPTTSLPGWTILQPDYRREPALLRLMQNFAANTSYFSGTGLVRTGSYELVNADTDALIAQCRAVDAGAGYQQLLNQVFTDQTQGLLTEDKRAGFLLAIEIGLLKGQLTTMMRAALHALGSGAEVECDSCLRANPVQVRMLGRLLAGVLAIELFDAEGHRSGVVLYMPSDGHEAFRVFPDWTQLSAALVADLQPADDHRVFGQLVGLDERAAFLQQLRLRLKDDVPDLQVQSLPIEGDPFAALVASQVARLKTDARLLLVPTALADATATRNRREQWEAAGLGLAGLAGFFIPVVGAVLLGQLVVQVLSEVFEGVQDWAQGHQHEALDHFLGVAETVAVTAAVVGGSTLVARGFSRSALVDGLQPVTLDNGAKRLWSADPSAYETANPQAPLQADGLYGEGEQRWVRIGQAWYEVHRPDSDGPWRLRHPQRPQAYGPIIESNGQRGWRLHFTRPLEWHDRARMLDTLWPLQPPLNPHEVEQILQIAGMDTDELRGLVVENRPLPVTLLQTMRHFETRRRIDQFFTALEDGRPITDAQIQRWCLTQPGIRGLDSVAQREAILANQMRWRLSLFDHLNVAPLPENPLRQLLQRDFPGLPDVYAEDVTRDVSDVQRQLALLEQRVPFTLARKARSLRQVARLSGAVEGLSFDDQYSDDTADLTICLLRRFPHWPSQLNIEVREGAIWGRRVTIMDPQADPQALRILVHRAGRFEVYDAQEQPVGLEIAEPGGLFESLTALLTPQQRQLLALDPADAPRQLRSQLLRQLPETVSRRLQLLGWRVEAPWFNPGRRLGDGRVGYLLSGRGHPSPSGRALRDRVRALYPGLNDQEVRLYVQVVLNSHDSPFDLLLEQEGQYRLLDRTMTRWQNAQSPDSIRHWRNQLAQRLRNGWRMLGPLEMGGDGLSFMMRLDLSGMLVRNLPELPSRIEFDHVSVVVLRNMALREVPSSFLRAFGNLRRLNLGSNELGHIPEGLSHLGRLRILNLDHNRIRLDEEGEEVLSTLHNVSLLNLSYNPLGDFRMRFHFLPRISWISLRHCQLSVWPTGLDLCGFLEAADLRNNRLTEVPEAILNMPLAYRRALMVENNPLSTEQRDALFNVGAHDLVHEDFPDLPTEGLSPAAARAEWLGRLAPEQRAEQALRWDRLLALPDSAGVFDLFGQLQRTMDFTQAPAYLSEQVWSMVMALDSDASLREIIFNRANEPLTCADSVAERFSDLQVQVLEVQANADADDEQRAARLLSLGRRLWRLARVEQFARQDMQQRELAGRAVDEIEVSLYYRVNLAAALDLPLQPASMYFERVANVTAAQLQDALHFVRSGETREAVAESLTQRAFWQHYLQAQHEQAFSQLQETFEREGSLLDEQMDALSSEEYRQRWDALSVRRDSAFDALRLQLTLEAMEELDSETPPG
ncbi:NEL-type E3 ubiquitin ligase domain-containing protein [Pseudomonas sp.]|uniref:NEL-type E3 ubiquitin ligase domain-containing protein n=1 Tax=Pseudomonas sp. TaxID=306 RepID=UPI0028B20AF5|nr:NEL-type E3 ubiquitin ligase domain-containing protein [Pseudomonas sp.]